MILRSKKKEKERKRKINSKRYNQNPILKTLNVNNQNKQLLGTPKKNSQRQFEKPPMI